jgi:copper transport protein
VAEVRTGPELAPLAVAGRWAYYWGLTLLVGAAATGLLVFGGRLPGRPALLLLLALAATAGGLIAMTASARSEAGVPLATMLGSTTGRWLLWRAAMLVAASAATWWVLARPAPGDPPSRPAGGMRLAVPAGGAGLLALGLAGGGGMAVHALAGHAAGPSSLRVLNLLAQWAHLVAVGVWIGGLAWLLAGLRRHALAGSARAVVVRFSKLAGISLALVVATGVARTVDELGGWARLADSGFGRALDLKLVLFAGLVALGAFNRYRLVPLFEAEAGRRAVARLRHSVGGELGLAAAVLAAAALLSQLAPGLATGAASSGRPLPASLPALAASGADWATTVKVTLTVTPGPAGPNRFTAVVADYDSGTVLPVDRVELSGTPADHPDLGTARLELTEAADGRWLGQGRMLSLAGRWNLTTTIQRPTGGITVPLALDVPPPAPS